MDGGGGMMMSHDHRLTSNGIFSRPAAQIIVIICG
jgi:hypothetical protein